MPIYVYRCPDCSSQFEKRQGFDAEPVYACANCGATAKRVIQPTGIVLKGSGWYMSDSTSSKSARWGVSDSGSEAAEASSDSNKAEGKSDAKAEGKAEGKSEGKAEGKSEGKAEPKADSKGDSPASTTPAATSS